ncbi:MAG: fumarylacetoacetase [Chitinophagales bacterium]|nr:MAG: fumarylacetoacetase [Chitinophagales bacterium]
MKLISYLSENETDQLAILIDQTAYDVDVLDESLPGTMSDFLWEGPEAINLAKEYEKKIRSGALKPDFGKPVDKLTLLAPVPFPTSFRDAYAFRQHVEAARRNRGMEMIPEFDQFPVFYFTNHNAVQGPGNVYLMPDHFKMLDFELEIAAVIGKEGSNIRAEQADTYIAGFTILNDLSARQLQMEEMKLNLGPAKGKDFANLIGPWLVTPDELEKHLVKPKPGHTGKVYNLKMTCKINGRLVSEGNMKDMDWTFAEIIERCSYGTDLLPGDVIGSGTVGTGCFLEINGTEKLKNPSYEPQWLKENDVVELEIEGLGKLVNTMKKISTDYSILALKK